MARGAILRAFDKEDGLERVSLSSYGFRLQDEYNPEAIPEHRKVKPKVDSNDGVQYVDVIDWVIKKVRQFEVLRLSCKVLVGDPRAVDEDGFRTNAKRTNSGRSHSGVEGVSGSNISHLCRNTQDFRI
jgi:hypothetical protein